MKPEDRQKYQNQATVDKQRYERQSEEFKKEGRFYDDGGVVVVLDEEKKVKKVADVKAKRGRKKPVEVAN